MRHHICADSWGARACLHQLRCGYNLRASAYLLSIGTNTRALAHLYPGRGARSEAFIR